MMDIREIAREITRLENIVDELLEVMENIASGDACLPGYSIADAAAAASAAIAKAKGEQP